MNKNKPKAKAAQDAGAAAPLQAAQGLQEAADQAVQPIVREAAPAEQAAQGPQAPAEQTEKKKKNKKEKRKKSIQEEIYGWLLVPIAAVLIAFLVRTYIAEPVQVKGSSMANTLADQEYVLASKLGYLFHAPQRGDIVICRYPNRMNEDKDGNPVEPFRMDMTGGYELVLNRHTLFVKRLVAVPGDTVEIRGGVLYVNGEATEDPKLMRSTPKDYPLYQLGEDEYFVIGDNRGNSHDSRFDGRSENVNYRVSDANTYVGPLHREQIGGRVLCVLLPLGSIRGVN